MTADDDGRKAIWAFISKIKMQKAKRKREKRRNHESAAGSEALFCHSRKATGDIVSKGRYIG